MTMTGCSVCASMYTVSGVTHAVYRIIKDCCVPYRPTCIYIGLFTPMCIADVDWRASWGWEKVGVSGDGGLEGVYGGRGIEEESWVWWIGCIV